MNILIILGHPEKGSFNHAITESCKSQIEANGHSVFFHDLYAERFNPLLHLNNADTISEDDELIKTHSRDLSNSDGIIIIHPNWWGQPPAIVKGWLDRVLQYGVAYEFAENKDGVLEPKGLLKAKAAIIFNSSNSLLEEKQEPLDSIWKNGVFKFCGVNVVERTNFCLLKNSTSNQRKNWLTDVKSIVNRHFPAK